MKHLPLPATALVVAAALALAACSKAPDAKAPAAPSATAKAPQDGAETADGIAWKKASSDADIDAAFATARSESKPVFLYWGAKWCPPCNQVQATLFNRQDFIERSRAFVPVYVDGDSPGAQKLGTRFRVSGYPTMVLLKPSGEEMTRLPGEVDPSRYTELLNLGMSATRPVKAVLADALAAART
jgi:thiol:disulfide interchange protein